MSLRLLFVLSAISIAILAQGTTATAHHTASGWVTTFAGGGAGDGGPAEDALISQVTSVEVGADGALYVADGGHCRARKVVAGVITTVAGTGVCGFNGDGVPATAAQIGSPSALAVDANGNLYLASYVRRDSFPSAVECRIRKVAASGTITTVAGNAICGASGDGGSAISASIGHVSGLAVDPSGDVYLATESGDCLIRRVSAGVIETVAGDGSCVSDVDGPALTTGIVPAGLTVGSSGEVIFADSCRLRKLSGGIISTIAGNGDCSFSGDGGLALNATLAPRGVAMDLNGGLLVSDATNYRIFRISGGTIESVAGGSLDPFPPIGDGGQATLARLYGPFDVAPDDSGGFYIADTGWCRVRYVDDAGIITTVVNDNTVFGGAGPCYFGAIGDGGSPLEASFWSPEVVGTDAISGDVYIADSMNCKIRKVSAGIITTVAGDDGCSPYGGDGGQAELAGIGHPSGVAIAATGDVYLSDQRYCTIRKVSAGLISTIGGTGDCATGADGENIAASTARLAYPRDLVVGASDELYVLEECRVRKILGGLISTFAGDNSCNATNGSDGGPALTAGLYRPTDIALDTDGGLLIADSANCSIRKVSSGVITSVIGTGTCAGSPIQSIRSVGVKSDGQVFISANLSSNECGIYRGTGMNLLPVAADDCTSRTAATRPAMEASLYAFDIALDADGHLYAADLSFYRVFVVGLGDDADGDGCPDAAEEGSVASAGGDRNHFGFWDFFDVTGDQKIDLLDTLLILDHFGHGPNDDGFDNIADRQLTDPSKPWRTTEDNNGIDVLDALNNLGSFGHECV